MKIAQFLRAGCKVKILFADIHGFLDNLKAPLELVAHRAKYYEYVIASLLRSINVPIDKLEFVLGSTFQKSESYIMDLYRLSSVVTKHDAIKAGAEVVKQVDDAPLSALLYPLMQALDEEHLGVDAQFGGVDQRKIFTFAGEVLPKIGYKKRAHLMNPMVPGLAGGKMSSSDPDSKIDVLDPADIVARKLKKVHVAPKEVEGNGIISFIESVLLPVSAPKNNGSAKFVVERKSKSDQPAQDPLIYASIDDLKSDYASDVLTPQMLKPAATAALLELLAPIHAEFQASKDWKEVAELAYPVEPKKKKAKKNKGSQHPGVLSMPDGHVEGRGEDEVNLGTASTNSLPLRTQASPKRKSDDGNEDEELKAAKTKRREADDAYEATGKEVTRLEKELQNARDKDRDARETWIRAKVKVEELVGHVEQENIDTDN